MPKDPGVDCGDPEANETSAVPPPDVVAEVVDDEALEDVDEDVAEDDVDEFGSPSGSSTLDPPVADTMAGAATP